MEKRKKDMILYKRNICECMRMIDVYVRVRFGDVKIIGVMMVYLFSNKLK